MSRPLALDDARVAVLILRLAGPAILGISAHALQMVVNAWFVADLGATAIATIAIAYPVTLLVAALGYGAGIAAASQVSRAFGAGDGTRAGAAAALGFWLALPAGSAVTVAILLDTPAWLRLLGADEALAAAAAPYTALATVGTGLMLVMIVGGFVVRAQGHARLSGAIMVGGFGLNIVLDAVLIRLCGLGTLGAGWAIVGAQVAAALAYLWVFARGRGALQLVSPRRGGPGLLGEALRLAVPVTGSSLLAAFAMALFVEAAAPYGAAAVAAQGIALRLTLVAALPLLGLVAGAQVVFGHAVGAGLPHRLRRALGFTVATSLAYGLAAGGLMIALAAPLVGLFAQEAETVRAGIEAVSVFALAFLPIGLQLTAAALFQAIGAPRRAAAVSLAAQGLALIPPLLIVPPLLGYEGVLVSRVVAEYLADGLGLVLLLAWAAGARRAAGAARIEGREALLMPAPHEAAHQSP